MSSEFWYYFWAALLVLVNLCAWGSTLFTLPGNWIIVLATALFAAFAIPPSGTGISWVVVAVSAGLAVLGEVLEFLAGAARHGGSRRGMVLAILGAMSGSLIGTIVGVPIAIVGPIIGALGGGMLGAFGGAFLGETWKGKTAEERLNISAAALIGRLLGTIGKLTVGTIMVVLVAVAAFTR